MKSPLSHSPHAGGEQRSSISGSDMWYKHNSDRDRESRADALGGHEGPSEEGTFESDLV